MPKKGPTNACGSTDNKQGEIWAVACETKDGSSEILVMASQVYQRDQLAGVLTDFLHRAALGIVHNLRMDIYINTV